MQPERDAQVIDIASIQTEAKKWAAQNKNNGDQPERNDEDKPETSKISELVRIVSQWPMFRSPVGRVFVAIRGEAIATDSKAFLGRTAYEFWRQTGEYTGEATIKTALLTLSGGELPTMNVPIRTGGDESRIILDLANKSGQVVEITANGVQVLSSSPIPFFRPAGTEALPIPEPLADGRSGPSGIRPLREILQISENTSFSCVIAFLLSALRTVDGSGGFVSLILRGEQGSGKTTFARMVRRVLDPRQPAVQRLVRNTHDLAICAENTHILAFDNLSGIGADMSDALCTLATGDGFVTRSLYCDRELTVFSAARPIILTSISDAATRPDLLDRSLLVRLPPLERRIDEEEIADRFQEAHPKILGALCHAASKALAHKQATQVPSSIRMRTAARFAVAAEETLGLQRGDIIQAYIASKEESNEIAELDTVASAVLELMEGKESWGGTSTDLLRVLRGTFEGRPPRDWPDNARAMRSALDRITPALRARGISISAARSADKHRTRTVQIKRKQPSGHSGSSADGISDRNHEGIQPDDLRTVVDLPSARCLDAPAEVALGNFPELEDDGTPFLIDGLTPEENWRLAQACAAEAAALHGETHMATTTPDADDADDADDDFQGLRDTNARAKGAA